MSASSEAAAGAAETEKDLLDLWITTTNRYEPDDSLWCRNIAHLLSRSLPEEGIKRKTSADTGKGYDTAGYGFGYVVDRLNSVLTTGGWHTEQIYTYRELKWGGKPGHRYTCDLILYFGRWVDRGTPDQRFVWWDKREVRGGCDNMSDLSAHRGSYTNALKRAAALAGVGWHAWGALDNADEEAPGAAGAGPKEPPEPVGSPRPASNVMEEARRAEGQALSAKLKELAEEIGLDLAKKIRAGRALESVGQRRALIREFEKVQKTGPVGWTRQVYVDLRARAEELSVGEGFPLETPERDILGWIGRIEKAVDEAVNKLGTDDPPESTHSNSQAIHRTEPAPSTGCETQEPEGSSEDGGDSPQDTGGSITTTDQ